MAKNQSAVIGARRMKELWRMIMTIGNRHECACLFIMFKEKHYN